MADKTINAGVPANSTRDKAGARPWIRRGAIGGGLLLFIAMLPVTFKEVLVGGWADAALAVLWPPICGSLAGAILGGAVWVMRARQPVSMRWVVLSWGLVGGLAATLVPAIVVGLFSWSTGAGFHPIGGASGPGPMTLDALYGALEIVWLWMIFCGLPVFVAGSAFGIVKGVKRARRWAPD